MTRCRFAWWWGCCCVVLLALPLAAQPGSAEEPIEVEVVEGEPEEEDDPGITSRLTAAGWCVLKTREEDPQASDGGAEEDALAPGEVEDEVGCDLGVGAALIGKDFRQGRLSLVGVLGVRSLGFGGAWTFGRQGDHPLSVAVGVVAPYSDQGIFVDEWAVAIGATVSVFGRR